MQLFVRFHTFSWTLFITYTDKKWRSRIKDNLDNWNIPKFSLKISMLNWKHVSLTINKTFKCLPGWCGSVDWTPGQRVKGHWFHSQSGHIPGLQARSPEGGAWEATTHWYFSPSLSLSLPLSLKTNK